MSKFNYSEKQERDFASEARDLIKGLKERELYDLYEIVQKQKRRSQTPERDLELKAVEFAINKVSSLDKSRLHSIRNGFRSSMAAEANARDGNTTVNKRKV
jgi:hypothetical protein